MLLSDVLADFKSTGKGNQEVAITCNGLKIGITTVFGIEDGRYKGINVTIVVLTPSDDGNGLFSKDFM